MSNSVGRVDLDLGINQRGLKKEITNSGKSLAKSLTSTLSVAVGNMMANLAQAAIKSLGGFLTSSVELGSSVAELENVTGKVFPNMQQQVEDFSKTAIQQYGLTELQAKKMIGTMGAMAQAFRFTEQESYAMSTQLTGLVGDVASFYNLDHDTAYTKIKSVFTGETESLKELGVVMTQTALDEFAMRKGMGKTVQQMSEQEKVSLRLAFVTEQLGFSLGDFAKTQHQWANQTRILSGQWDSFKTALGQGFIAVLTPVIQKLNELMGVVVKLGEKFRDFIMLVTGQGGESGAGALVGEIAGVTAAAAETAETASGTASKAAKEVKRSVLGFDKLNKLADPSSGSGGSGSSAGNSLNAALGSASKAEASADSLLGVLDRLKDAFKNAASWLGLNKLWKGIKKGIDKIDFDAIRKKAKKAFDDLKPIASAGIDGMGEILRSKLGFIGTILGQAIALIGKKIELVLGGFSKFLAREGKSIESWIGDVSGKISTGFDNLTFSAENIFGSLWDAIDQNKEYIESKIADTLSTLSLSAMTIGTIFSDMWAGLTEGLLNFTTEEKLLIDDFFNGIIESIGLLSDSVNKIVGGIFKSVRDWWETEGVDIWNSIVAMFFDITGWLTRIWQEFVKPVIDEISKELSHLWDEHLKPLWDNILEFISSIWDKIDRFWKGVLKPLVDWLIDFLLPIISDMGRTLVRIVGTCIGSITDFISALLKSLRGTLDFIDGVFTGDWEKAWDGIKTFFEGICDGLYGSFKSAINLIIEGLNFLWSGLYGVLRKVINGVGGIIEGIGDILGKDWGFTVPKNAPMIPRLAEGGFVKANQPQLAMIGDNKRHGEIVAPEDKLYEIVSKALQAFMGQLVAAISAGGGNSQRSAETLQLIVQVGEETIINRLVKLINAESKRQGTTVIKA